MTVTVLVISNRLDETADYLCSRMAAGEVAFVRLDTESAATTCSLAGSTSHIELRIEGVPLTPANVSTIWYRRPHALEPAGSGDRYDRAFAAAEWTAGLEGFLAHVPAARWMNHPANIMAASSKLEQLARSASFGFQVPAWVCTTERAAALRFFDECDGYVVTKPLYSGYIERATPNADTVIFTSRVHRDDIGDWSSKLGAPTLFQREVVGLDVRVTVVEDEVTAIGLMRDDGVVDIRTCNMMGVRYSAQPVPDGVTSAIRALVHSYGLRFAALDFKAANGVWHFLEINPNGQWAWLDLVAGTTIFRSFLRAFRDRA